MTQRAKATNEHGKSRRSANTAPAITPDSERGDAAGSALSGGDETPTTPKPRLRIGWDIHRKAHYATPEALAAAVDDYFEREGPHHLTGMALALGFTHRNALDYWAKKPGFKEVLEYAKTRVEAGLIDFGLREHNSNFADRMLTRMGYACVEQSKADVKHEVKILPPQIS